MLLALLVLGAGGVVAAAWMGLIPGVQLRDLPADRIADGPTVGADTAAVAEPPLTGPDSAAIAALQAPLADPTRVTAADSAAGAALYAGSGRCVGCHGVVGEGVTTLGPSIRDAEWLHGDSREAISGVIAQGASPPLGGYAVAMPAYGGQLSVAQLAQITAYVWVLSHPGAVQPDTLLAPMPTAPVPTAAPATVPTTGPVPGPPAPPVPRPTVPPPTR